MDETRRVVLKGADDDKNDGEEVYEYRSTLL